MKYCNKSCVGVEIRISYFKKKNTEEQYLILSPSPKKTFTEQINSIENALCCYLTDRNINSKNTIFKRFFVSDYANQYKDIELISKQSDKKHNCSISVVQQAPLNGEKVVLLVYIINDKTTIKNIKVQKTKNELILKRKHYSHIWNTQLISDKLSPSSYIQTENIFNKFNINLNNKDLSIKENCIRTWLFVKDVDFNYDGVVKARNAKFDELAMTKHTHFIASTGIEGRHFNPKVNTLMDTYSIDGVKNEQIKFIEAPNNLNPTHQYGVAFERGTSVDYGDRRHTFISGTASIDNKGKVVYKGDINKQIERVLENISALLANTDTKMEDVSYFIIYLRDISDTSTVSKYFETHYIQVPKVIVLAPVCRPEWLIEIECVAIKDIETNYHNF